MAICRECKKEFEKNRKWQVFCSNLCRVNNWDKKNPRIPAEDLKLFKMYKSLHK